MSTNNSSPTIFCDRCGQGKYTDKEIVCCCLGGCGADARVVSNFGSQGFCENCFTSVTNTCPHCGNECAQMSGCGIGYFHCSGCQYSWNE